MAKCEIYEDQSGEWRWRNLTSKGDIVKCSSMGFKTREEAEENGRKEGTCNSYKVV